MKTSTIASRGSKTATPYTLSGLNEIKRKAMTGRNPPKSGASIKSINTPTSGQPQAVSTSAPMTAAAFEELQVNKTKDAKPAEPVPVAAEPVPEAAATMEVAERVYIPPLTKMAALRDAKQHYIKASNGQLRSTDDLAETLDPVHPLDIVPLVQSLLELGANPYAHLNPGQQSMNMRNKLRGALRHGRITLDQVANVVPGYVERRRAMKEAQDQAKVDQ